MIYQKFLNFCAVALVLFVLFPSSAQAEDIQNGKALFLEKCASCHNNNMVTDMTGPKLYGVEERWAEYPEALYDWIRNSVAVAEAGNPRAKVMINWAASQMTSFENLSNEQIDDILVYIEAKGSGKLEKKDEGAAAGAAAGQDTGGGSSPWLGYTLVIVLLISIALLGRYINSLTRLSQQQAGVAVSPEKSVLAILLGPGTVKLLIFALILFGGYTTVNSAINLGRQQNYAPEQPIKFSHAVHAGENGINCQYCHDGARRSKHSVIPASNTCINCHANIQKGSNYGTEELIKVYAASGFNPLANAYIPAEASDEERAEVLEAWLRKTYEEEWKKDEAGVERMIKDQLASVEGTYNKPIEWVRIHNLPDHAYFNHAQHVSVGKIKCQTCHGEVEKMEVMKQHSPLSMGWCVNCHRQTEVQFKDGLDEKAGAPYEGKNKANPYYTDYKYYERYHNELEDKKRTGVTVEEVGGLECQKCHY